MSDTKHTPGPWTPVGQHIEGADGGTVQTEPYWLNGENTRPDVVLICAAPDLLAALENAPEPVIHMTPGDRARYREWFIGIRAAVLAKVKP